MSVLRALLLSLAIVFCGMPGTAADEAPDSAELLAQSEAGNRDAQFRLANWYRHGIKVKKDLAQARRWFEAAAANGRPEAAYELGLMYEAGHGVPPDLGQAAYWYRLGARLGHTPAQAKFDLFKDHLQDLAEKPGSPAPPPSAPPAVSEPSAKTVLITMPKEPSRGATAEALSAAMPHLGRYHALVIGNNNYRDFPDLKTAVTDARAVARLLAEEYGFEVTLLIDAGRFDVLSALSNYRKTLTIDDNLLIYYAGHGIIDSVTERGYWLPVDAHPEVPANWLSTTDITDLLKAIEAWHILVVADSCYSGTLLREAKAQIPRGTDQVAAITRLLKKRSRTVLSSGGVEPVVDGGGGGHSVFARAFLETLREAPAIADASSLFSDIRHRVVLNAEQTPEYSDIRLAGHDGGDFVFARTAAKTGSR